MHHATALMDNSMAAALRQVVLSLIKSLLMPLTAATNPEAEAAAKANGTAFVESGGVQLLVDMLTGKTLVTRTLPQPLIKKSLDFMRFIYCMHRKNLSGYIIKPDLLVSACDVEQRLTSVTPGAYVHSVAKLLRIFWALAGAHEASERIQAPLQSNLIAMNSQAEEVKEWFYYTTSGKADAGRATR